jgi:hypothetical protein
LVEQFSDGGLRQVMGPDVLGRYLFGVHEGCDGLAGVAALRMGTGNIDEQARPSFW